MSTRLDPSYIEDTDGFLSFLRELVDGERLDRPLPASRYKLSTEDLRA
jgi:hypothetical protein